MSELLKKMMVLTEPWHLESYGTIISIRTESGKSVLNKSGVKVAERDETRLIMEHFTVLHNLMLANKAVVKERSIGQSRGELLKSILKDYSRHSDSPQLNRFVEAIELYVKLNIHQAEAISLAGYREGLSWLFENGAKLVNGTILDNQERIDTILKMAVILNQLWHCQAWKITEKPDA